MGVFELFKVAIFMRKQLWYNLFVAVCCLLQQNQSYVGTYLPVYVIIWYISIGNLPKTLRIFLFCTNIRTDINS